MGPTITEKFAADGIEVLSSSDPVRSQEECEALIERAGEIDILIANLAEPPMTGPVHKIDNADWGQLFDTLVHPLMYLIRAVTPQMIARQSGKIIAVTSAAPLRGIPNHTAYCAARGAQNAFIKAVGLELARDQIQVNAICLLYTSPSPRD